MSHKQLFKDIVLRFAQESKCESKKVAALAVKNNRIVSTGINGTISKYINCCDYFKQYYNDNNILESLNLTYDEWIKTSEWRKLHHEWSNIHECHAEINMIIEASKNQVLLKDCDIYVSLQPCEHCTKSLISLEVKNIYYVNAYDKNKPESMQLLKDCNINIEQI